jgi:spore maturation protein SpmA
MALNYIWIAFFLLAFVVALVKLVFLGDTAVFPEIINSTFASSKTAFEISLGLTGVLSLWLGIMKIGERGGVIQLFARLLSPLFSKLFPEIPKGHPVTGSIFMNLAANMLGLDNAAISFFILKMEKPVFPIPHKIIVFFLPDIQGIGTKPRFIHRFPQAIHMTGRAINNRT